MKKITDERLKTELLISIRRAFIIQTLGIIILLVYQATQEGIQNAFESPLFFILLIVNTFLGISQLKTSIAVEDMNPQKRIMPYYALILISLTIAVFMSLLVYITDQRNMVGAFLVGVIFFICFLATFSYSHYLKKKQQDDRE